MVPSSGESLGVTLSPPHYSAASGVGFYKKLQNYLQTGTENIRNVCVTYSESGGYIDPRGVFWVPAHF